MLFGTYDLGYEPLGESKRVSETYADNNIKILKVGKILIIK